ncbi:(2Fe-2S)-binding protein [Aliihoeflea aestuarii]|uniref:(2Fe-2S)-binding protein n=1 Tax=Aliihoeflea aestuarii TaxID=453840 RepID=UPI003557C9EB
MSIGHDGKEEQGDFPDFPPWPTKRQTSLYPVRAAPVLTSHTRRDARSQKGQHRMYPLQLTINGKAHETNVDPRVSLLDLLRENLGLTGSKKGCDHGQCGACTVIVNGRRINSCLSLAVSHDGDEVTTIEGMASDDGLSPLQAAFVRHDAFQCGYCTPGQICSATALLEELERGEPSVVTKERVELADEEIRERMSGNLCRCGAYNNIIDAILEVAEARA